MKARKLDATPPLREHLEKVSLIGGRGSSNWAAKVASLDVFIVHGVFQVMFESSHLRSIQNCEDSISSRCFPSQSLDQPHFREDFKRVT